MLKRAVLALLLALWPAGAWPQTNAATTPVTVVITLGNTFQTILAALTSTSDPRRSLTVQNNNSTDSCWLYLGSGTATKAKSILLLPGGSYTRYYPYVPSDALQATCTTTNDTMYLDYQ